MPLPTWRLALLGAAAAPSVLLAPTSPWVAVLVVAVLVLLVGVVDAARAPAVRALHVERELPDTLALDHEAPLVWTVRSRADRPLRVALADALPPSLQAGTRRARLVVPGRGAARAATTVTPARRGSFGLHTLDVRVEGPWRLAARQGRQEVASTLRVTPRFTSRRQAELRVRSAARLIAGLRATSGAGEGGQFDALREYTPDDEVRRIDWAATARSRAPIVRTYREERNQHVLVLVDTGRSMAGVVGPPPGDGLPSPGTVPRLDHALDAVLALMLVATGLGDRVGVVTFAERVQRVVPPRASGQLARVTSALFDAHPRLVESDYRGAFAETLARFGRRALLVVLTELAPQTAEETLLPSLPLVLRDHVVMVVALRDPAVDRWARAVPEDTEDAYRAAAAVRSLTGRAAVVARVRGLGATVLDTVPGRLPGELADAYLQVKATGRL